MAGQAAIAVKSPRTMMASSHRSSQSFMRVSKTSDVIASTAIVEEHMVMIGKHGYQSSLGLDFNEMMVETHFAPTKSGSRRGRSRSKSGIFENDALFAPPRKLIGYNDNHVTSIQTRKASFKGKWERGKAGNGTEYTVL